MISFDEAGSILISDRLLPEERTALGLQATMRLRKLEAYHQPYLTFHREHVFRKLNHAA
jgi:putative restriction endonuclease